VAATKRQSGASGELVVAQNRRAPHDYELLERYEAGLELRGSEVKSLRQGHASLREAYAEFRGGELWLEHCHIPPYAAAGRLNHDPLRPKKLLLHRHELDRLAGQVRQKGLTVVPLRIYFRNGIAKCELALARGRRSVDRRAAEREREARREAAEALYRWRRR
jgi:SsrA-binding protein